MTENTPWQVLWEEINAAMEEFGYAQANSTGQFLTRVRMAVTSYGESVDPSSFDELGQPIEHEEVEE